MQDHRQVGEEEGLSSVTRALLCSLLALLVKRALKSQSSADPQPSIIPNHPRNPQTSPQDRDGYHFTLQLRKRCFQSPCSLLP